MSGMAPDAAAAAAARRSAPRSRCPVCTARRGSVGLPRVGSQWPLCSRACGWRPRCSGGPHDYAPSDASIAGEAVAVPSHHSVGLDEHERRAPAPPRLGQHYPKQPVSAAEMRACNRAPQRGQLLAQCEVLEDQFVMSAASQRQGGDDYNDRLQHAPILSFYASRINRRLASAELGERHGPARAALPSLRRTPHWHDPTGVPGPHAVLDELCARRTRAEQLGGLRPCRPIERRRGLPLG